MRSRPWDCLCPAFATTILLAAAELAVWLPVSQYCQPSVFAITLNLASFGWPITAVTHTATPAFL